MHSLADFSRTHEKWLLERVRQYAEAQTHLLPGAQNLQVQQSMLSPMSLLLSRLEGITAVSLSPSVLKKHLLQDLIRELATATARGVAPHESTLPRQLLLLKCCRKGFRDLVELPEFPPGTRESWSERLDDCFDLLELAVASWRETNASLSTANTQPESERFANLTLLYRVSNTMLTTISLNKLIHIILTALTVGDTPFFDRAALFLTNERSGFMQGMLGVTRDTSFRLGSFLRDPSDILSTRWEISDEDIQAQESSEYSRFIKGIRLELDKKKNASSRAVIEKRLIFVRDAVKAKIVCHDVVSRLGITSFAVAPLIAREKVFGVVVVDNALSGRKISQSDLGFLQLFTNQAGAAVENTMLYSRLDEANRSLAEAHESLVHGERLATIGEMSASLAHELKSPLISIGGFARRLLKQFPSDSADYQSAEMIANEALRLEKMLGDILAFGKKTTLCFDTVIMQDLVDDALAIVGPSCRDNNIRITRQFQKAPNQILGDRQQLKQVLLNLFFNAIEAMAEKGGGELTVATGRPRQGGRSECVLKVSDTGGGVPNDKMHKLFSPFFTTKDTGTGLGLPIAHRIITNHGGTILVNNRGGGLHFTITLPSRH